MTVPITNSIIGLLVNDEGVPCTECDQSPTIHFGMRTTIPSSDNDNGVGWDALDIQSVHEVTVERKFHCRKKDFQEVAAWLNSLNGNTYNAGADGESSLTGVFAIDGEITMTPVSPTIGLVTASWTGYILDVNYKLPSGMTWERESDTTCVIKIKSGGEWKVVLRLSSSDAGDGTGLMIRGGTPVPYRELPEDIKPQVKRAYAEFPLTAGSCKDGSQFYEAVYRPIILSVNGEEAMRWWILVYADGYSTKVYRCREVYYGSNNAEFVKHDRDYVNTEGGTMYTVYGIDIYTLTFQINNIGPLNFLSTPRNPRLFYKVGDEVEDVSTTVLAAFESSATTWTGDYGGTLNGFASLQQKTVADMCEDIKNKMEELLENAGYLPGQEELFFNYGSINGDVSVVGRYLPLPQEGISDARYNDTQAIATGYYSATKVFLNERTEQQRTYTMRHFVPASAVLEKSGGVTETVNLDTFFMAAMGALYGSQMSAIPPPDIQFLIGGGAFGGLNWRFLGHVGYVFFEDEMSGDSVRSVENSIKLYWLRGTDGVIRLRADHKLAGQDVLLSFDPNTPED